MQKILITGGNGFIGKHVKAYLEESGYIAEAPSSDELNIVKESDWNKWNAQEVEHVIHLAGKTFVPDSWEHPEEFFEVNVTGTLQAIRFCRENKISMTYISAYIYGLPERNPIAETAKVNPNNPYAKSKYMAEELCEFFCKQFDMDITVLRLFNVYGPRQNDRFLIPYIMKQVLEDGDSITVQDLEPKRDYVYIDDVCEAIRLSVEKTRGFQLFNIGTGKSYAVSEIINIMQGIAKSQKKVCSKNNVRKNELNEVIADVSRIRQEWGWIPQVTIEEGLRKYLEVEK